jgi:plasmid stabilization system protein ParE
MIHKNPTSFPIISDNVRKIVLHKNVSLYYEFNEKENTIEILSIFENRQNPDKLKL